MQLAKNPIARRDTQTITSHVFDAITHQPVSGATVFAIVRYADGMTVRNLGASTDTSGQASVSWQIESDTIPSV